MDSPQVTSPVLPTFNGLSSRSRSSTKLADDVTSLTSFNPFSEEDENDQSSYTIVTSIFSLMKNTLAAPISSAVAAASGGSTNASSNTTGNASEPRRLSYSIQNSQSSLSSRASALERPIPLSAAPSNPAPPLISLTPVVSEAPSYTSEYQDDRSPSLGGSFYTPVYEAPDGGHFGTAIPGFPIQDDARSVRTTASLHKSGSVSKVIRRIRGEGLSRDYWMDDENCRECYDCKSIFTTWRRKHHCRICGQIFCSRCASNIIKGSRFGHNGMVRVCNLCLGKLAKDDDDDDDDHRSVVSSVTSFPAHQMGGDSIPMSLGHHVQSPFAASQLFGRTDEPFNLYSIAETKRPVYGSEDSGLASRPVTPRMTEGEDGVWEPVLNEPVPFRRGLVDEEKEPVNIPGTFSNEGSPTAKTPIDFPVTVSVNVESPMSSIQFPVGSPDWTDSPRPQSRLRSRFNSYGDFEATTPFIRSRVQSRLDNVPTGEPGWRTRRESTAYAQELNLTSMLHLKIMLRQMLTREEIPNLKDWEDTLLKLALRIARELTFTALPHRQGEDMDVRRYVKIKKIPGGIPQDSEYVDGAVITKNVAHKQMSRFQRNPRVMLVTFPLEFYRVEGQYMHFGQIVRQEKEYLGNLASRIAALRPHVVLVEKSVSRLALDALVRHNIAVARTVKPSAIQAVARMTQGDVFSSMDRLALEPRLGHCARFRIQTYDHALIPGRRKTYMRFEGCSRDMGCTIILRGSDIDTLRRIKKVTRFLTFIVRNLKLETHLWKDSVITLPSFNPDSVPTSPSAHSHLTNLSASFLPFLPSAMSTPRITTPIPFVPETESHAVISEIVSDEDLPDEDADQLRLSRRIRQALEPYTKTFISVSATLRFPPPHPVRRMQELDNELITAKRAWEDEVIIREERGGHAKEATITLGPAASGVKQSDQDDINAQIEALPSLELSVSTPDDNSRVIEESNSRRYFNALSTFNSPSVHLGLPPAVILPEVPVKTKTVADIALESQLSLLKWQHEEQRRIWEWYLRKNRDDFVVEKYQCISLWEYVIPIAEFGYHRACFAPQLKYITFYGENDCTLGQYIEKAVGDTLVQFLDPKAICAGKGCNQPLARHCRIYVHNESRLFVAVEQWDGQIIGRTNYPPSPDLITTWSACRVCGSATPFIPVSEEMQRYSFAKFLELHFYPADVKLVQGAGCQHNIYQHHIRYFAAKGMTVRFQADPVALHEIVYPPKRIRVHPESQLVLKNSDFNRLHYRNVTWYSALVDDLKLISTDAATGDEEIDARLISDINMLITRAEAEKQEITHLINQIYGDSSPTDTIALNRVRAYRQDKIVAWQQDFDRLPKPRPAVSIDGRKSSAFGSVRAMWPKKYDTANASDGAHVPSSSVSEAEEGLLNTRRAGDSLTSSASDASEPETNAKKIEKDKEEKNDETQSKVDPPSVTAGAFSDPDSDSTIGAARDGHVFPRDVPSTQLPGTNEGGETGDAPGRGVVQPMSRSRLPRRPSYQPSVAELVKKYQYFLPPSGVEDLAKTAFPPRILVSESEQEYTSLPPLRQTVRSKSRHHLPAKKTSISDFEQGYAANIAPRYLTHSRRPLVQSPHGSRIPGPIGSSYESSRRPSPEKRPTSSKMAGEIHFELISPTPQSRAPIVPGSKTGKGKSTIRATAKEKPIRPPSVGSKSTFRRQQGGPGSKVSNIAKHFERINRDTERANRRYAVIRGRRARPVASARAKVEVLDSVKDAIKDESEGSDSSSEADDEGDGNDKGRSPTGKAASESSPDSPSPAPDVCIETAPPPDSISISAEEMPTTAGLLEPSPLPPLTPISLPPSPFLSSTKMTKSPLFMPSDLDIGSNVPEPERLSILKALSGFWLQPPPQSRRRGCELEGDDIMSDPEHIFRDSSMVVRTDEPTSIIALALNSPQYREMLAKSRAEKRTAREPKLTDGGEAFMPDDRSIAESTSTWGVVNVESVELPDPTEDLRVPSSKLPWAISFESGGLTISCTVLYPEQFDALRRTYDCEKSIIESLARCVKWDANGGKSGSAFLKTRDDRFIAKELSRAELQTMETFAPAYFDYMSSAVTANRPTLLAKVFGCYKLTFKKAGKDKEHKSKSTQMNLVVMENLFYDRRFFKIYDLKGSTRNRHVQSTGRENEVLLDENLVETAHLAPFYLREHSKRILRGALYNDSKFLADLNVMDYSLIVGVDSQKNELVVGIVDYIRTYTWDKKLESWVKESAFLGSSSRGEPTIVTPKQYRQRFISAMERYFPLVPDRWMKQKDTPEEDSNSLLELWPDW